MKRLLIVDDDDAILEALVDLLAEDYEVTTARDGKEALVAVERASFDAILLDVMMPELDGVGFKRELDARGVKLPIVVMSAGSHVAKQAQDMGVRDFVRKPFDLADLERALHSAFSGGGGAGGQGAPTPPETSPGQGGHDEDGSSASRPLLRGRRRSPRSVRREASSRPRASLGPRPRRSIARG